MDVRERTWNGVIDTSSGELRPIDTSRVSARGRYPVCGSMDIVRVMLSGCKRDDPARGDREWRSRRGANGREGGMTSDEDRP